MKSIPPIPEWLTPDHVCSTCKGRKFKTHSSMYFCPSRNRWHRSCSVCLTKQRQKRANLKRKKQITDDNLMMRKNSRFNNLAPVEYDINSSAAQSLTFLLENGARSNIMPESHLNRSQLVDVGRMYRGVVPPPNIREQQPNDNNSMFLYKYGHYPFYVPSRSSSEMPMVPNNNNPRQFSDNYAPPTSSSNARFVESIPLAYPHVVPPSMMNPSYPTELDAHPGNLNKYYFPPPHYPLPPSSNPSDSGVKYDVSGHPSLSTSVSNTTAAVAWHHQLPPPTATYLYNDAYAYNVQNQSQYRNNVSTPHLPSNNNPISLPRSTEPSRSSSTTASSTSGNIGVTVLPTDNRQGALTPNEKPLKTAANLMKSELNLINNQPNSADVQYSLLSAAEGDEGGMTSRKGMYQNMYFGDFSEIFFPETTSNSSNRGSNGTSATLPIDTLLPVTSDLNLVENNDTVLEATVESSVSNPSNPDVSSAVVNEETSVPQTDGVPGSVQVDEVSGETVAV